MLDNQIVIMTKNVRHKLILVLNATKICWVLVDRFRFYFNV